MTNILNNISKITLQHYQSRAESFWQGTKDHDVSQNIEALCQSLDKAFGQIRCKILDFGCGPGRDLLTFRQKGHEPVGLDGCPAFVEHARQYSGCNVWQQDFLHLELPKQTFHGIFANASFFQIPSRLMPDTLSLFHQALLPGGVLFMSNPRGQGEGFFGDRYATYLELEDYSALLEKAGFDLLDHYYRPPGLPREEQPWLAVVAKKLVQDSAASLSLHP